MRPFPTPRDRLLVLAALAGCGGAHADVMTLNGNDGGGHVASIVASDDGGDGAPSAPGDDAPSTDLSSSDASSTDASSDGTTGADPLAGDAIDADGGQEGAVPSAWDGPSDDGPSGEAATGSEGGDGGVFEASALDAVGDAGCGMIGLTLELLPSSCAGCLQTTCGATLSFCLSNSCDDCLVGVTVCENASCAAECPP
jgi:hypothetical protein